MGKLTSISPTIIRKVRRGELPVARKILAEKAVTRDRQTAEFHCSKCGIVPGRWCAKCRAELLQKQIHKGVFPTIPVLEGDGPEKDDPTEEEIQARANAIKQRHLLAMKEEQPVPDEIDLLLNSRLFYVVPHKEEIPC